MVQILTKEFNPMVPVCLFVEVERLCFTGRTNGSVIASEI